MDNTQEWEQYHKGLDYQSKISYIPIADKNERFYSGNQWQGLNANKLSLIVLNVIKKIGNFKRNIVISDNITMQFSADIASDTQDPEKIQIRDMAKVLTDYAKTAWENLKVDNMLEDGILDSQMCGDMLSYWFWNDKINSGTDAMGNPVMGDLDGESIDGCNYIPGDPNDNRINDAYGPVQPYIILAFRRQVKDVKAEAKENGIPKDEIDLITADDETQNQFGDRAKTELDADKDEGKCIVLLKLWPKNGIIMAKKSVRQARVRKEWDTELHRYPVALFNWEKRKGSAHGEADFTYMIPNQIEINRTASMIARWVKIHGFPKVLYDKTRIPVWTNDFSMAMPVNGDITSAANYMQPAQISAAVMGFMTWFIQITKEMAGANESALGESAPTNTSAILVNSKSATTPLNSIKRRYYNYVEDIGLIWLDIWLTKYAKYPEKLLTIKQGNITQIVPFNAQKLQSTKLKIKIDVGPSNQWNEAAAALTLDNLLNKQLISFVEYLKRLPNGTIPDKQGLIESRESTEAQAQAEDKQLLYELMAQFVETLPPEALKELDLLKQNAPDQYEAQVKALVKQKAGGGQSEMQAM